MKQSNIQEQTFPQQQQEQRIVQSQVIEQKSIFKEQKKEELYKDDQQLKPERVHMRKKSTQNEERQGGFFQSLRE
jgi:hypothetical protein